MGLRGRPERAQPERPAREHGQRVHVPDGHDRLPHLNGTQTVVLDKDVTATDGTVYKAGTYEFNVDGRYWAQFNRANPIEAAAREQAWTGTAHALIAELGVGSVTASTLQMGLGLTGLFAGPGFVLIVAGLGLVWAVRPEAVEVPVFVRAPQPA